MKEAELSFRRSCSVSGLRSSDINEHKPCYNKHKLPSEKTDADALKGPQGKSLSGQAWSFGLGVDTGILRHGFGPERSHAHQWVALPEPDVIARLVYVKSTRHTCHCSPTSPDSGFPGGCCLA